MDRKHPPKKFRFKSLFEKVGKWYISTSKFEEPEAAAIRTASWLQNYYVETMLDHPNRVTFKVTAMGRDKNSPFNFINYGTLTFRKVADAPHLEVDYQINMEKTALSLIYFPINQAYALLCLKWIVFEGLIKDPRIMPSSPEKLRLTKNELLILYVVIAPVMGGLIEVLNLWQDHPAHPAIAELFIKQSLWTYEFMRAVFLPVGLLCTWMLLFWIYMHEHRDTIGTSSEKNKQDLMILVTTILLMGITIIWAIYQVYINLSGFSFYSINFPGFSLEYWMGGICLIWAIGFAFLFVKYFK